MSNENFRNKHSKKLLYELKKFLLVYNSITSITIDIDLVNYNDLIVLLGRYINNKYNLNTWSNDVIIIDDSTQINFSVFKGTEYESRVGNFLESIYKSFNENDIKKELEEYFKSDNCIFNLIESHICMTFYELVDSINKHNIKKIFSDNQEENSEELKDAINKFNFFVDEVSKQVHNRNVLFEFDKIIKELLITKIRTEILF